MKETIRYQLDIRTGNKLKILKLPQSESQLELGYTTYQIIEELVGE